MPPIRTTSNTLAFALILMTAACSDAVLPEEPGRQRPGVSVGGSSPESDVILPPVIVTVPECDPYTDANWCQGDGGGECMTEILPSPGEMVAPSNCQPGGTTGPGPGSAGGTTSPGTGSDSPAPAVAPEGVDQAFYEDLNEQERRLCWRNPGECLNVKQAADYAALWAAQQDPEGAHNGPQDAMRHAMWNARMTQMMGFERAKVWADAHESSSTAPAETRMDLYNNAAGRDVGRTFNDIALGVWHYRNTGQLCLYVGSC